jgi:two-component sensor histidine kinase
VPLGLIVNELVTNAIQHSQPSSGGGRVQIVLKTAPDSFSITVLDEGDGPALQADAPTHGLGARMIEAFSRKIAQQLQKGATPQVME